MCIAAQDTFQNYKILLCFRKTPKTTPLETCQIARQIPIRSLRKAQYFLVLLVVNDVLSCTFPAPSKHPRGYFYYMREVTDSITPCVGQQTLRHARKQNSTLGTH